MMEIYAICCQFKIKSTKAKEKSSANVPNLDASPTIANVTQMAESVVVNANAVIATI